MSKTLTKEELVRAAWLVELRRQGNRKCEGAYSRGTKVCALGLLAEVAKLDWEDGSAPGMSAVGKLAGLTYYQSEQVAARNDGTFISLYGRCTLLPKHTFAEIANVVEGWFKKP